VPGIL